MTPAARVQATLELLQQIHDTPRPADTLTGTYFRARRFIGSKDRAALSTRLYAVLRHQARLDWWLEKYGVNVSPRARLLAWLSLGESLSTKAIDEICSGGKFAPAPLADDERGLLKKTAGSGIEHPEMPEDIAAECPPHLYDILKQRFGKNFNREMAAMLTQAPMDLRVNILKSTREEILKILEETGIKAVACPLSPWGIRVFERPSLANLSILQDGLVDIQDEGSQLVALATDAKPGERVVDFCAGAGGKTLALGAMMGNKGRITACDVMERRLKASTERFRRAGLHNIETHPLTSERDPWVKKHKGMFDRVLVDAPCSGTGTWRRNPDTRWRNLGPDLETLLKLQTDILDSAARLVKAGGRLIYATCSLLPQENEKQIEHFLSSHPDFALMPCGLKGADYLSLTPAQHETDGFFTAVLVKEKKPE